MEFSLSWTRVEFFSTPLPLSYTTSCRRLVTLGGRRAFAAATAFDPMSPAESEVKGAAVATAAEVAERGGGGRLRGKFIFDLSELYI